MGQYERLFIFLLLSETEQFKMISFEDVEQLEKLLS